MIVWIGNQDRAIFRASGATRAFVLYDIPGLFGEGYPKISRLPLHALNFCIGQNLYIGVTVDLDHLGCEYSGGAVIGGKGLVKLCHLPTDGWKPLNQIYLEA